MTSDEMRAAGLFLPGTTGDCCTVTDVAEQEPTSDYVEELEEDLDEARDLLMELVDYCEAVLKKDLAGRAFLTPRFREDLEAKLDEARIFNDQWEWVDQTDSSIKFA